MKSKSECEIIFAELRKKHGVILPCVSSGRVPSVSFTQNHSRYNYWWFKRSTEWELFTVPYSAPTPSDFLGDLIKADIVTLDGKVNFEHRI